MTNSISSVKLLRGYRAIGPIIPLGQMDRREVRKRITPIMETIMGQVADLYRLSLVPSKKQFGQNIDCYCLDNGGTADVYLLENRQNKQRIVVKRLKNEYVTNEAFRAMFKREAALLRRNLHPGIPRILNASFKEDECLIALPFVEGMSLIDFVSELHKRKIPLRAEQALVIIWYISNILAALEEKKVLHCDIKPDNFILSPDHPNYVVLLDFGAGKDMAAESLPSPAEVFVHPDYVAPELLVKGAQRTSQSEIFALGILFIKLFHPKWQRFATEQACADFAQQKNLPVLPGNLRAGIPKSLRPFIQIMVQRRPEDRPAAFQETKDLCEHLLYDLCCR